MLFFSTSRRCSRKRSTKGRRLHPTSTLISHTKSREQKCVFGQKCFFLLSSKTQLTGNKPLSRIKTKKKANISNQRKLRRQRQCRHKTIISPIYNSLPHDTRRCFRCGCLRKTLLKHFEALNSSYQSVATYHLKTNITPLTRFCLLRSSFSHFSLEISFWNFSISLENESERITPKPFITSVVILQGAQGLTQRRESPLLS